MTNNLKNKETPPTYTPEVSVLIPCLNEAGFILPCIKSLLEGSFPEDNMEILVIDGGSTDGTLEELNQLAEHNPNIKTISNPKKTTPAAMNLGIREAKHGILLWCGAHALYHRDYIKHSVETLLSTQCASAGGTISPIAKTNMGKAIAIATTNKFGIGNAKYRYADQLQTVDTVFGGCFRKEDAETIGGFNENWKRNQDYEFNFRLRQKIGKIILNPLIRCQYYCRESIFELIKQYFQYGYWRFKTVSKHPSSLSIRQIVPVALILSLILSIILVTTSSKLITLGLLVPTTYLSSIVIISLHLAFRNSNIALLWRLPLVFCSIHLSWGAGFIYSFFEKLLAKSQHN